MLEISDEEFCTDMENKINHYLLLGKVWREREAQHSEEVLKWRAVAAMTCALWAISLTLVAIFARF